MHKLAPFQPCQCYAIDVFFAWLADFVSIRIIYVTGSIIYMLTGFYALSNKALQSNLNYFQIKKPPQILLILFPEGK